LRGTPLGRAAFGRLAAGNCSEGRRVLRGGGRRWWETFARDPRAGGQGIFRSDRGTVRVRSDDPEHRFFSHPKPPLPSRMHGPGAMRVADDRSHGAVRPADRRC